VFIFSNWTFSPAFLVLLCLLLVTVFTQIGYFLWVFLRVGLHKTTENAHSAPAAVSVVVCAHNEFENLQELLPLLQAQEHPVFEIIVINDRSADQTEELAKEMTDNHLRFINVEQTYDHVTPKKYAITTAIRAAKYEIILLTDADCRPASTRWIEQMTAQLTPDKDIVLGFSPYYKEAGFLNKLIRFETFYVAVQYMSFALFGRPYMGVGRNLLYRKSVFLKNRGFYNHLRVMGGDDDLLMNEIANAQNTSVCLHPDAFVYSIPKTTWQAWFRQKTRHLSVSKYYQKAHKWRLGLLSGSHVLSWLFFLTGVVYATLVFDSQPFYLALVLGIFATRLLVQWLVLGLANRKLGNLVGWYAIPFFDFVLFIYYLFMSVVMWQNRKKKIAW
jgi:glycosyltransferase involved in cell wall biosynthesis